MFLFFPFDPLARAVGPSVSVFDLFPLDFFAVGFVTTVRVCWQRDVRKKGGGDSMEAGGIGRQVAHFIICLLLDILLPLDVVFVCVICAVGCVLTAG